MRKQSRKNGFTLVELLAVMAVIGVLAAMVLGISGYASRKSDEAKATADIEKIKNILEAYRVDNGIYPNTNISVWHGVIEDRDETFYVETDELKDPWGKDYIYEKDGKFLISVYSAGPDGNTGTIEDNVGRKNM